MSSNSGDYYSSSYQANFGMPILPIKRIELFSAEDWEDFIEEWLELHKKDCFDIEKFGGAGDKGRDVVFYITDNSGPNYIWDCYQCKHYDNPLMPTQIYVELGKIIYYSFKEDYPIPRNYYFIAPKGCGTTLTQLLQSPKALKSKLKENWIGYCQENITIDSIKLEGQFLKYFNSFDFSIFSKKRTIDILNEHKQHPNHLTRFGGGLPKRERVDLEKIPEDIQKNESLYVEQLLKVYNADSDGNFNNIKSLVNNSTYNEHFKRARVGFHHAEQLRNFSRDSLPPLTFDDFQDEIYNSIIDVVENNSLKPFSKVKDSEKNSRNVVISSNPLKEVILVHDRVGVCHQLVNDNKVKWIKDE